MRLISLLLALCFSINSALATTIAFDGKTLSSDGQATVAGHTKLQIGAKVFYNSKRNLWIGCAGDVITIQKVLKWFKSNDPTLPKIEGEIEIIIINSDGEVLLFMGNMQEPCNLGKTMFAMGSGGDFALGAMLAGKSSAEAIDIASKLDCFTSGEVTTFIIVK